MEVTRTWGDEELLALLGEGVLTVRDATSAERPVSAWLAAHAHRLRLADGSWPPRLAAFHPTDRLEALQGFKESLARPGEVVESVARWCDGEQWRLLRIRRLNLLDDPRAEALLTVATDGGTAAEALPAARSSTDLHHESPPWALLYLDNLGTVLGSEGMVEELVGRSAAELAGSSALDLIDASTVSDILAVWVDLLERPGEVRTRAVPLRRADGSPTWVEVSFINRLGAEYEGSVLVIFHDISAKRAAHEERQAALHRRAEQDALTGLLNRSALDEHLEAAVAEDVEDLVVLFLDLDGFKAVNDSFGHDAGDAVLRAVGERLRGAVRPTDHVGRYGGDELVAICPGVARAAEGALVQRIEVALDVPVVWPGGSCSVHASVGVARHRAGEDVSSLLRRADASMFERKRARYERAGARSGDRRGPIAHRRPPASDS